MKKKREFVLVAQVLLLCMVFVPCAKAERGVTDTEIRIGQWGPQTGPAALWGAVARGTGCYFKMINDEGGIHGRTIKYFLRDDGYMPPRTKAIAKELVEDKEIFAFASGVGSATGMAVKKYLHKNRVPWVGPAAGSTHWAYPPTKYLFGTYPLYCDEAAILIDYAVKKLGKKRIAFFYQNDDYGKEGLYGAELALKKYGMDFVTTVSVEPLDTDLNSHTVKLKEANPDCVLNWVLPKHGAIILITAAKMGFKPQWMTTSTLSDTPIMYKISRGLFKDVVFTTFAELPGAQSPLMQKYKKAHEKFAPKDRWGMFFYAGFYFVEPMVEAFRRCGKDLTVDNFVKAMESIKGFKGIGPEITFSPTKRQGARASFVAKCAEGGKPVRVTDWMTSDLDVQEVIKRAYNR
ncbi:MAG: ABC transporter substrate-binding protein [Desulfatiglans sp.]|nr:ABC transporter substrate-binding protein [Thermodesulfobacteriota bacterium]MEE4352521.1 ABC transporter substrate-binding protein [Desulfatiglans sp.]